MSGKIGVYFDQQNIGGGLDLTALAEQTSQKWGGLVPVVKVVPVLALAVSEIKADIEAQELDGVLLCGASPRVDSEIYRLPVQVEFVNLREQCVQAYKNPDKTPVDTANGAPELLAIMARDYVNMGVVKLQKSEVPDSAAVTGVQRVLVIGGGWTGLTAAAEAAESGYDVVLVEKADKLGGAANNIPMGSPLASPWTDKQPTNVADKISKVLGNSKIAVHMNTRMEKLEGQPGEFKATFVTPAGTQTIEVGAVVLATGWVPLDPQYLSSMGLGQSTKVVDAATFGKMLVADQVSARRIAFVLDTTMAEEAVKKAAEEAEAAPAEEAAKAAEGEEIGRAHV